MWRPGIESRTSRSPERTQISDAPECHVCPGNTRHKIITFRSYFHHASCIMMHYISPKVLTDHQYWYQNLNSYKIVKILKKIVLKINGYLTMKITDIPKIHYLAFFFFLSKVGFLTECTYCWLASEWYSHLRRRGLKFDKSRFIWL